MKKTIDFKPQASTKKAHNQQVLLLIVLLGLLLGLRLLELIRLTVSSYSHHTQTLIVDGKGRKIRELPVIAELSVLIQPIVKRAKKEGIDALIWMYDSDGNAKALISSEVTMLFSRFCEESGMPVVDFGGLRHNFRSALFEYGVEENLANYLMGHSAKHIGQYTIGYYSDRVVRAAYQTVIQQMMKKYGVRRIQ